MENSHVLSAYACAVDCFQHVHQTLQDPEVDEAKATELIDSCIAKLDAILLVESDQEMFAVHIQQLKTKLLSLREKDKPSMSEAKPSVKRQTEQSNDDDLCGPFESTKIRPKSAGFVDIVGSSDVKNELKAMIILPRRQPQLYEMRNVYKTVLLYGPPGTGKTKLAHALAAEADGDIYCVTSSTIKSPYMGVTEKTISALFGTMKSAKKTSFLFIDEIDGLCRKRNNSEADHYRSLKTEILCHFSNFNENPHAYLICATNCPWDLDTAFLRRFHKRIYIPLPDRTDRAELLKHYMGPNLQPSNAADWDVLLDKTEGYSGSDIEELVRNATLRRIKELEDVKIWKRLDNKYYLPWMSDFSENQWCNLHDFSENLWFGNIHDLPEQSVRVREPTFDDVLLEATRQGSGTTPREEIERFDTYNTSSV